MHLMCDLRCFAGRMMRTSRSLLAVFVLCLTATVATADPPPAPFQLTPAQWDNDSLVVGYIGHASVLIKMSGTFILTDPAFNNRIGASVAGLTVGPERLVQPALGVAHLPKLSAVLISHAHFDSLDLPSLRELPHDTTLVGPQACADLLDDLGFARYVELAWGQTVTIDGVTIEAVPVNHWGRRWPWGKWRGYNAYLLSKGDMHVLFAPDTAYTPEFGRFAERGPALTVAILGNGAYDPWILNHANPEQVWKMFRESGARFLIPIHWDTFRLGREPIGDAMTRLLAAAGDAKDSIVIRDIGAHWSSHPN